MVKNIVKDIDLLSIKSSDATKEDLYIINDLLDTIKFNSNRCVGLAANMIGYNKKILVFENEDRKYEIMINPSIISKKEMYTTKEGCLSLIGQRECIRYNSIKVSYLNEKFEPRIKSFKGFVAEIIEHEMDHFEGIII